MNYLKDKIKENEQFPKVITKEDTKELISIIESLNSKLSPQDKIGFNLQYRQVKLPSNVFQELKKRKSESMKIIDKEKVDKINLLYEKNKSKDEQINRAKLLEIENLEKNLKKLNREEADILRECENSTLNLSNLRTKTNNMRYELRERNKEYDKKESEYNNDNTQFNETEKYYQEILNKREEKSVLENYRKKKFKVEKEEKELKRMLCHACQGEKKMIYYSACRHLSLCKKCYSKYNKYEKNCPICNKISELILKITEENKKY